MRLVPGSKSRTESIMAASRLSGSATMYCHVAVTGSKDVWISGIRGSRINNLVGILKDNGQFQLLRICAFQRPAQVSTARDVMVLYGLSDLDEAHSFPP